MIRPVSLRPCLRSRLIPWILSLVVLGLVGRGSWAELKGPTANDRQVTVAVKKLLAEEHLLQHPLDDEIAERFLTGFLKMLDPMKVYFYKSDVDGFRAQQSQLDDQIKKGDVSFAYTLFNTLLKRVDERVALVDELLVAEHDFTIDEEMVIDADLASYPEDPAQARDLWRKRIKYDLLMFKAEKLDKQKQLAAGQKEAKSDVKPADVKQVAEEDPKERLKRKYHSFARRMHQTDEDELLEMYLTALATAYDPHSSYMSKDTLENFEIIMRLNLEGIGASLKPDDGYTVVHSLIPGGAADKDGRLKPEDRIVGVGEGENGEIVDVSDMKLSDVVERIRGKRDTVVRLQVIPVGETERKIYNITRARIELTDSEARGEVIEQTRDGQTWRIGVIDLPSFYMDMEGARRGLPNFKSTTRDVAKILEDFRGKHVDAVILDLRRNGGGSLTEAISLTGLFIDEGPVVQVKDKDNRVLHYDDMEEGSAWDGPLVVLISKFSASASEIFAGAMQDYGRGIIVGDRSTHGKGTVQSLMDLGRQLFQFNNAPPLGALKVTMQQFYRPSGDSTQNRGVLADIELPSLTTHYDVGEADLDYALDFDQIDPVPFDQMDMVDDTVLSQLKTRSADRRKQSQDFQKLLRNIERYQTQKSRKTISLNEEKFLAERAELNAEKEVAKEIEELNNTQRPVFDTKFFYNQEALAITLDYLQLVKLAQLN